MQDFRFIGRVFREIEFIGQWGSGIGCMYDMCREAGTGPHDPLRRYLIAQERAGYGRDRERGALRFGLDHQRCAPESRQRPPARPHTHSPYARNR